MMQYSKIATSLLLSAICLVGIVGMGYVRSGLVTTCDKAVAEPGVNLIDDGEWHSYVADMSGRTLKKLPLGLATLLPDGHIAGRQDSFLTVIDTHMNVVWSRRVPMEIHHSIDVDPSGIIWLLSSDTHTFMGLKVRFDVIRSYSPDGRLLSSWCAYDHLKEFVAVISRSAWVRHLPRTYAQCKSVEEYVSQDPGRFIIPTDFDCDCDYEFTHFTSVQVLPANKVSARIKAFRPGNLLVCFNPYSSYGIVNPASGHIEWTGYTPERVRLHSPTLTDQGTILVFHNNTDSTVWGNKGYQPVMLEAFYKVVPHQMPLPHDPSARRWSSVTEYDAVSGRKVWEYTASPRESLLVPHMGGVQRLRNGNTLICTATRAAGGRAFEVTRDKKTVWDYVPDEQDEDGHPKALYSARRISTDLARKYFPDIK